MGAVKGVIKVAISASKGVVSGVRAVTDGMDAEGIGIHGGVECSP